VGAILRSIRDSKRIGAVSLDTDGDRSAHLEGPPERLVSHLTEPFARGADAKAKAA